MLNPNATRQELRAILANPHSTREQTMQVKLFLARRIADGPNKIKQVCERYKLSPKKSAELIAGHRERLGKLEAWAEQEVQALEQLLASEQTEPRLEQLDA